MDAAARAEEDDPGAGADHRDDGHHLDDREPELALAVALTLVRFNTVISERKIAAETQGGTPGIQKLTQMPTTASSAMLTAM